MFIIHLLKEYRNAWKQVQQLRRRSKGAIIPFSTRLHTADGIKIGPHTGLGPEVQLLVYPSSWNVKQGAIQLAENVKIGARAQLFAGSGSIMVEAQADIGHGAQLMAQRIDTSQTEPLALPGTIQIGAASWIGAGAIILADTTIGKHCVVAAGSVVQGHYPDFTTLIGNPARPIPRSNA